MKILSKCMIIILTLSLLSGCWDYRDIDHRLLPVAMGISKSEDKYQIVLLLPSIQNGQVKSRIITGQGETVTKTIDTLSENMESRIDLLHVKVIMLDKDLAQSGFQNVMSGFMRARDVSPHTLVAISEEKVEDFFHAMSKNFAGDSFARN